MQKAVNKKKFVYIIEKNITLEEFRNKFNKKYKPVWKGKLSDNGVALSIEENTKSTYLWWVGIDYFNKNYIEIEEEPIINEKGEINDDFKKILNA